MTTYRTSHRALRDDPNFPGIKLDSGTAGKLGDSPPVMTRPDQPQCNECNSWLDRYYTDVPLLQSRIKSLEDQVNVLTKENDRLPANDKSLRRPQGLYFKMIFFKNVEAATD
jgi:hypothetical protein